MIENNTENNELQNDSSDDEKVSENLNIVEAEEGENTEGYKFPWGFLIVIGVLIILFAVCAIVIFKSGGPI